MASASQQDVGGGGGSLGSAVIRRRPAGCSSPLSIIILGVFLLMPIGMAAWVSISDWNGNGSPFGANAHYVGLENYRHLLTEPGLDQNNFGTALRNNVYYVLLVVPIQTAVALFLAVLVNRRAARASGSSGPRSTSRRSRARSRSRSSSSSSSRRPA